MSTIHRINAALFSAVIFVPLTLLGCSDEATPVEPPDEPAGATEVVREEETVTPTESPTAKVEVTKTPAPARGPRLVFRPRGQKYGWRPPESTTEHTFELSSGGTEALVIKKVEGAAGCEVSKILVEDADGKMNPYRPEDPIAVGRNIHVLTTIHSVEMKCDPNARVTVISNDPRGSFRIGVAGDIVPFFATSVRFLNFDRVRAGETAISQSLITANDSTRFKLEIVGPEPPPGLSIELRPVDAREDGTATAWRLAATLGPEMAEGTLSHPVTLKSDVEIPALQRPADGSVPVYQTQMTVSAEVLGDFSSSPQYLSLGLIRSGQAVTRTVKLECNDPEFSIVEQLPTVRITGLKIAGTEEFGDWEYAGCFNTEVHPVAGQNAVEIVVSLFEGLPAGTSGTFRGTLVIDLEHPRIPRITKVITGVCR